MTLPRSVAEVLGEHVTLEVECIDRMYLNLYQPRLQHELGVVGFFKAHRGFPFVSSALMDPISKRFVADIHRFVADQGVDLVSFAPGQRKDDLALAYLAGFHADEGVLFVGRAQEKTPVFRTEKRHNPTTGATYPWLVRSTAMVNHFYVYAVDCDFGPFFVKFCTYFPYNAKVCLNGNEWAKRQAAKAAVAFEALDNGFAACDEPSRLQRICDHLDDKRIDRFVRKWLARLPHPFTGADRRAGYRYDISILQAEFSLTQVLDAPVAGRLFFEEVVRDNIDLGRPDRVSAVFDRRICNRRKRPTPGRFRTRIFTDGVVPSLHVDYKASRVKQYHKEGVALRTETTINDTATSASANGCTTCPHSGRSASPPTDGSSPSNESATTPPSARLPSTDSHDPSTSTAAAPPPCASAIPACTPCWPRSSCSVSCPTGSPIATSAPTWRPSSAEPPSP